MTRTLVALANVSIDGFTAAADGDVSWLAEQAAHEQMSTYAEGVWRGADTVLVGRSNFEGFHGYWPSVAADPTAPARQRALATWLNEVEKIVVSSTLTTTDWANSRVLKGDLVEEVRALKAGVGRDIIVLNSASVIRALLAAGLVDDLRLNVLPEVLGAGLRLLDGVPRSSYRLAGSATLGTGAVGLSYRPR